jgi:hypothetical protein
LFLTAGEFVFKDFPKPGHGRDGEIQNQFAKFISRHGGGAFVPGRLCRAVRNEFGLGGKWP